MNKLFLFLDSIYPLSEGLRKALMERLQVVELTKKDFILKEGQISHNIYFFLIFFLGIIIMAQTPPLSVSIIYFKNSEILILLLI